MKANIIIARILSGLVGIIMLSKALEWILEPSSAASGLAMTEALSQETNLGRNTLIGDFTSFFISVGLLSCIGAFSAKYEWIYGPISLLAFAAFFRIHAGIFHGTDFLISAIIAEIVMTFMLLVSVYLFKKQ